MNNLKKVYDAYCEYIICTGSLGNVNVNTKNENKLQVNRILRIITKLHKISATELQLPQGKLDGTETLSIH